MSRRQAAPCGELSARGRGGVVPVHPEGGNTTIAGTVVIFVHGFKTDTDRARKGYNAHLAHVAPSTHRARARQVRWFHWPGDQPSRVPVIGGLLARIAYERMIPRAEEAGVELARYLRRRSTPTLRVRFVAHSLGNRVVLEAMRALRALGPPRVNVDRIHLMAAAVPVSFCEPGEVFGTPVTGRREMVSFSGQDSVLGGAFPLGQRRDSGLGSQAVGRHGYPFRRWSDRYPTQLEHGEYWTSPETAQITALTVGWTSYRPPPHRKVRKRTVKRRMLAFVRVIE